jgi:hypothetical protein
MTKLVNQDYFLQKAIDNCDLVILTSGAETVKATAQAVSPRVEHILTAGDFSLAAGDVSGRKLTLAQQVEMTISGTAAGTGNIVHANFFDGTTHVTTAELSSTKAVTVGDKFTTNEFDVLEFLDPA